MIYALLFFLGLCLGSFINAWVWRLRQQLDDDGEPRKQTKKQQTDYSIAKGRSMCPSCKHGLMAKDLVPVASWVALKGRCRYCKAPISAQYPLIELLVAALFVGSYIFWPFELTERWQVLAFTTWLFSIVPLVALAVYDAKWQLLPDRILKPTILVVLVALVAQFALGRPISDSGAIIATVAVTSGLFFAIYVIAGLRAKVWLGFGDVKLGILLGLLIASPGQGMLMLFLASVLGLVWVGASKVVQKRPVTKEMLIPFGPFLIIATCIVVLFGLILWITTYL